MSPPLTAAKATTPSPFYSLRLRPLCRFLSPPLQVPLYQADALPRSSSLHQNHPPLPTPLPPLHSLHHTHPSPSPHPHLHPPPRTPPSTSSSHPPYPLPSNVQLALLAKASGQTDAYGNTTRCICLTGDHRVLTRSGWRSITHMQVGDVVLTLNIRAPYAQEWKRVTAVTSHAVDPDREEDRLYRMQGSGMDVIATRDHRMLLARLDSTGLSKREPLIYERVAALLPPHLTYSAHNSTTPRFLHTKVRAVVRASLNTQPGIKIVIPGLERVCEWWWEEDKQLGFLTFLGLWLSNGYLARTTGSVRIGANEGKVTQVARATAAAARVSSLLASPTSALPTWAGTFTPSAARRCTTTCV